MAGHSAAACFKVRRTPDPRMAVKVLSAGLAYGSALLHATAMKGFVALRKVRHWDNAFLPLNITLLA